MGKYKIMLYKGSKKYFCPDCGRKSFHPYIWADTGEVINPNLGHCDHDNSCGHSDKLQAVLGYVKSGNIDDSQHKEIEVKDLPTYVFPTDVLERLSQNPLTDNFTTGIRNIFGSRADEVFKEYSVVNTGAEKFHRTETQQGKNTNEANDIYKDRVFNGFVGFVYLDKSDRCRGVKMMQYNKDLHRAKYKNGNGIVDWLHKWNDTTSKTLINEDTNEFHECYYGENLLKQGNYKVVGIVESEKTALIGRICCPDTLFIAVGGIGKVKYDKLADLGLQREKVIFYADAPKEAEKPPKNKPKTWGQFVDEWQKLAPNWHISEIAERTLKNGQDIADILLGNPKFADELKAEAESFSVVEVTTTEQTTQGKTSSKEKKDKFLLAWDWLSERYDLQFDTMRQMPQYKLKGKNEWIDLIDSEVSAFYSKFVKNNCKITKNQIYDLFAFDEIKRIHPIKDYFDGLQPYTESEPDYINELFRCIMDIKDNEEKLLLCKKFFVGIVKTVYDDKFAPQMMLILRGVRNSGKTYFVRYLCPDELMSKYFCETAPDNNNDLNLSLTENLFVFFDELQNFCKPEVSEMKALITVSIVKRRRAYGRFTPSLYRIATMVGACNDAQFLRDQTGDRKYLVIEANKFDYEYSKISINDCYRQAIYLMKSDFDCRPTSEEVASIVADNEQYRIKDTEEDLIDRYFYPPKDENDQQSYKVKATDILQFLTNNVGAGIRLNKNNIGKAMQTPNRKFIKKRGKDTSYWLVNVREQFKDNWECFLHSIYNDDTYRNKMAQPEPIRISFDADYNSNHNTYQN